MLASRPQGTRVTQADFFLFSYHSDSDLKHHKHGGHDPKHRRPSSKFPASSLESLLSGGSSSGYDHDHGHDKRKQGDEEDEILIVLLDDKKASWHGYVSALF